MNRVVLITGGGSGIGKACAILFVRQGDVVYISGRNEEKLKTACKEIEEKAEWDASVGYVVLDVRSASECQKAIQQVVSLQGRLDVLINSAGISYAGPTKTMTEQNLNDIIDTNLKGTFWMCQHAIPYLEQTKGCIVNLSSDAGVVGNKELAAYCASKGGVTILTKSLALELASAGIRVNAVCPSQVDTPMLEQDIAEYGYASRTEYLETLQYTYPQQQQARFIQPGEVAELVMFLADGDKAGAITGAAMVIDFGITAGY